MDGFEHNSTACYHILIKLNNTVDYKKYTSILTRKTLHVRIDGKTKNWDFSRSDSTVIFFLLPAEPLLLSESDQILVIAQYIFSCFSRFQYAPFFKYFYFSLQSLWVQRTAHIHSGQSPSTAAESHRRPLRFLKDRLPLAMRFLLRAPVRRRLLLGAS